MLVRKTVWIARDKDNSLCMYNKKPIRSDNMWELGYEGDIYAFPIPETWFPKLTWEDEPRRIKFGLKKKTEDDKLTDKVEDALVNKKTTIGELCEST